MTTPKARADIETGISVIARPYNRPGLDELSYRVGDYHRFKQKLVAALSQPVLPGGPSLATLTTRSRDDGAIALLDAWSIMADVLTFFQERIANEGFLNTATERLSVLELARSIGYELQPRIGFRISEPFRPDLLAQTPFSIGTGLTNPRVTALLVDELDSGETVVFAGTAGSGVFQSSDRGKRWHIAANGSAIATNKRDIADINDEEKGLPFLNRERIDVWNRIVAVEDDIHAPEGKLSKLSTQVDGVEGQQRQLEGNLSDTGRALSGAISSKADRNGSLSQDFEARDLRVARELTAT